MNKQRIEYDKTMGENISFMLLIHKMGLIKNMSPIRCRITRGWNADKAIDTPIRKGNYKRKSY